MKVAILSNIFQESEEGSTEVEGDLMKVGKATKDALDYYGHEVKFYDVNDRVFEKLRKDKPDIAFNVCERFNGSSFFEPHVASMLELLEIPYTGSGPLALATCINKPRVKAVLMHNNILTPRYQVFYSRWRKMEQKLKFPVIVKPTCMDNSIGIDENAICQTEEKMRSRINYLLKTYNQPALVEEFIKGREINVAVMGTGKESIPLPLCEVTLESGGDRSEKIMNYNFKWSPDSEIYHDSALTCPAEVPKYVVEKMQKIAVQVHQLLECDDYSRIDFRLDKDNNAYVLEMNPNPGISADCFVPTAAESVGLNYKQMINAIFCLALERYKLKNDRHTTKVKLPQPEAKVKMPEVIKAPVPAPI